MRHDFSHMPLDALLRPDGFDCECGRRHGTGLRDLRIGRGAVEALPEAVRSLDAHRPMLVCDENTWDAAGGRAAALLDAAGISYGLLRFPTREQLMPDERELGWIAMNFDPDCDLILGVGGGVINDLCKMAGRMSGRPCALVATAPSMDGLASNSGAMEVHGVKTTIYAPCPAAVICDTEIMAQAPERMLRAGIGDMIAKYISVCEWRMSHIINGEYYCESVADMMREAVRKVVASAERVLARDPDAVGAVAEGLVLSGIAMSFAGVSRPASGLEHCFSHIWEMMALERGRSYDFHGIQVGVGTMLTLNVYDFIRGVRPTMEAAERAIQSFDRTAWEVELRRVFGGEADALIDGEQRYQSYEPAKRRARARRIVENWDAIQQVIREELPDAGALRKLAQRVGLPMTPAEIGFSNRDAVDAFAHSCDLRDRYLSSSMLRDIGALDDCAAALARELKD